MFKFTKTSIFFVSIIIIFCLNQIFIHKYSIETEINENIMNIQMLNSEKVSEIIIKDEIKIWQIEIPKISLSAEISEGVTQEILDKYVGHFENTQKQYGNIGLAAYNRGDNVDYFKDLKLLKEGDEITYKYNEFEKIYEVEKCRIIRKSEWEYLEDTEENMLTLITFVENQPEYRRCIQAIEKEVEIY